MFGRALNPHLGYHFLPQIITMSLQIWSTSLLQFRQVNLSKLSNLLQIGAKVIASYHRYYALGVTIKKGGKTLV